MSEEERGEVPQGGAGATRAACASTASTCPDPQFDENGGAQIRIGRGSGDRPRRPEVPEGAEGVPGHAAPTARRRDATGAMRRALAGGAAVAAGLVAAGRARRRRRRALRAPRSRHPARATATVERRDLVDRENVAGTLGYADAGTLAAGAAGTLTALREPGHASSPAATRSTTSTASRPRSCSTATLPAWRDFAPGHDRRRGRPPARAQPARARPRPGDRRRRLGLPTRPRRCKRFQRGARARRGRHAQPRRDRRSGRARPGSARRRPRSATRSRPGARWPRSPRPSGA